MKLAPLVAAGPEEAWSQLAAVVVALAVSEPRPDADEALVLTVIERPTSQRGGESCR